MSREIGGSIAIQAGVGLAGLAACGVFGWLSYHWVQHEVAWRPTVLLWQYALPAAVGTCLLLLARRDGRADRAFRLAWMPCAVGLVLAVLQWRFAPTSPWLLYGWMALLVWAAWLVGPRLRVGGLSNRRMWLCVALAAVAMTGLHIWMQIDLWHSLSFGYRDIGLFVRALHNAAAGHGLWVDSLDRSILAEHAFLGLWALVPFCEMGIDPFLLLVVLSAVCLNGSAFIVAMYVRRRLASNVGALLAAVAWLMLPTHGTLVVAQGYGFHAVYLAVPILLGGFALGGLGHWRAAAVVLLACVLIREDIALTVATWGVYVLLVQRRRSLGAITATVAIGYLVLAVFLIVPHYRGAPYPHLMFHFREWFTGGDSIHWRSLATNTSFLLTLLLPLALLPLRQWRWCLVAVPSLAETMLTKNAELHNICFQYYTPAMVVLFFAAVEAWRGMIRRKDRDEPRPTSLRISRPAGSRRLRPVWCLLVAAVAGQTYLGVGPLTNNVAGPFSHAALRADIDAVRLARSLVPPGASVTASYRVAAHFLDVERLWTPRDEKMGDVIVVHDADLIDEHNPRDALVAALRTDEYQPLFANYHLVVLARGAEPTELARQLTPETLPAGVTPMSFDMGRGIRLVGMAVRPLGSASDYRVTLVWQRMEDINADYRFGLTLGEARWGPFFFARGAYPPLCWKPGRLYRDGVDITVPSSGPQNLGSLRPVLLE